MIYELINPSDKIEFEAESDMVAAVIGIILGRGSYGVKRLEDGMTIMHVYLFGDVEEGFLGAYAVSIETALETKRAEIITALETVICGSRVEYANRLNESGLSDRDFFDKWQDIHRSSMNDIAGTARRAAERAKAA